MVDGLFGTGSAVAELTASPAIVLLATGVTWWTVFIEATIAITFLWPESRGLSRLRDGTLLAFAAST